MRIFVINALATGLGGDEIAPVESVELDRAEGEVEDPKVWEIHLIPVRLRPQRPIEREDRHREDRQVRIFRAGVQNIGTSAGQSPSSRSLGFQRG
jgi:hypothetical protein